MCYASKPIFDEPTQPVQSAVWFNDAITSYLSRAPDQRCVFLLANLLLDFQHKASIMYCPDTYFIPLPPQHYSYGVALSSIDTYGMVLDSIRRTVTYFVECSEIPDNDRGYWHSRLMNLLKSFEDDYINKN